MSMARGALVTWGRVLRISLWPTAVSDGLAGFALAGLNGCPTGSQWGLFGASMGIYHGAMALNGTLKHARMRIESRAAATLTVDM